MTATANAKKKLKNAPKTAAVVAMNEGVLGAAQPQGRDMLVPLNELFVSKQNARTKRNSNSFPELKALILAMGLMQRLTIVEENGRYGVVTGGRRYEAMMLAVSMGEMAADALIECKLYDSVHSAKLSLAENSGREEMHPADQIASFKRLIDEEGMSVAEVATSFCVTPMTVERRLKLSNLSPRFIDMYREGKIDSDILAVFTLGDDHQTQEAAWDSLSHYDRSAYHLREVLLNGELKALRALQISSVWKPMRQQQERPASICLQRRAMASTCWTPICCTPSPRPSCRRRRISCWRRAGLGSNAASNRIRASTVTLAGR
jgi:ParB family chromosome partitioning protein